MFGNVRGQLDHGIYIAVRQDNVRGVELGSLLIKAAHSGDCYYHWIKVEINGSFLLPLMKGEEPVEYSGYEEKLLAKLTKMQHRKLMAGMPVALNPESLKNLNYVYDACLKELNGSIIRVGDWVVLTGSEEEGEGDAELYKQQVARLETIGSQAIIWLDTKGGLVSYSAYELTKVEPPKKGKHLTWNGNVKPAKKAKKKEGK